MNRTLRNKILFCVAFLIGTMVGVVLERWDQPIQNSEKIVRFD